MRKYNGLRVAKCGEIVALPQSLTKMTLILARIADFGAKYAFGE